MTEIELLQQIATSISNIETIIKYGFTALMFGIAIYIMWTFLYKWLFSKA